MKTHLVIGNLGEVGSALQEVLQCDGYDIKDGIMPGSQYDFIHLCISYFEGYENQVKKYQEELDPEITIIHTTVPVGTTRKLGEKVVHSPIHGIHPNLFQAIKTFIKFIGAVNYNDAQKVLAEFQKYGIKGFIVKNPETSELSKLGCTTRHGLMIIEQKLFKQLCDKNEADFSEAYTLWNRFYGIGYEELGQPYIRRAVIEDRPGKIGGHCILPNCKLLDYDIAKFILDQNEKL